MYSPRKADISVPQFFHFLTWELYSPKPGAWSTDKGAVFWSDSGLDLGKGPSPRLRIWSYCSNASLSWDEHASKTEPENYFIADYHLPFISLLISAQVARVPALRLYLSQDFNSLVRPYVQPGHDSVLCQDEAWVHILTSTSLLGRGTKVPTLPLHTRSPGPHKGQPHSRAAGKHSFVSHLPLLLLSFEPQLRGQLGSWIIC